ncbi:MAG: S49 family peptidase, partial [bacterium]|nr:S49 family peptidase [bacterium]
MTPFTYPQALHRLCNRPLLVTPAKASVLFDVLRDRASWDATVSFSDPAFASIDGEARGRPGQFTTKLDGAPRVGGKPFQEIDGIAVIAVHGTLVQRNGLDPYSGMTGYDGITRKLEEAAADPEIDGIILDVDSYGGEVAGCFDACDVVMAARQQKPVWAICTEFAYSAAYALA